MNRKEKDMKKIISIILVLTMLVCMVSCRPSERVSYNVSKEADSFGVVRKLTVINCRTDSIMMELVGTFSLGNSSAGELSIICKTGEDAYKKHYVYLNDWTAYTVEDISGADVDPYSYEILFYPEMLDLIDVDARNEIGTFQSGFGG